MSSKLACTGTNRDEYPASVICAVASWRFSLSRSNPSNRAVSQRCESIMVACPPSPRVASTTSRGCSRVRSRDSTSLMSTLLWENIGWKYRQNVGVFFLLSKTKSCIFLYTKNIICYSNSYKHYTRFTRECVQMWKKEFSFEKRGFFSIITACQTLKHTNSHLRKK